MTALVLQKMIALVALMLLGFAFTRKGWIDISFSRTASFLVMNVFIVGTILTAANGAGEGLSAKELALSAGGAFLIFAVGGGLGWLLARLIPAQGRDRQVAWISMFFMNNVFIGFPLVEAVFGQSGILCASLTNLPFNLLLYTVGAASLRQVGKVRLREAITAPLAATLLAILMVLFDLSLPTAAADALALLGAATVPVSMLVVGISLSRVPIRDALTDWRAYLVSGGRLLVCPLVSWCLLGLFLPADSLIRGVLTLISACPSAAMVTILCVRYGTDDRLASKVNFLSTLLCAVTMPVLAMLLFA